MSYAPQGRRSPRRRRKNRILPMLLIIGVLAAAGFVIVDQLGSKQDSQVQSSGISAEGTVSSEDAKQADAQPSEGLSPEVTSSEGSESSQELNLEEQSPAEEPSSSSTSSASSSATSGQEDWRLVLVNASNKLDGDYDVALGDVGGGYQLDARITEDMKAMIAAAKADGYTLQICSAYRSTERSRILYNNKVSQLKNSGYSDQDAAVEAAKWVAPPGTSEHNTGLAADIVSVDYFTKYAELEHDFEKFDEFKWLYENCADYGFVLRYPKDKQEVTGITYEPWHYRYVGKENARKIMDQKICLEEFLSVE